MLKKVFSSELGKGAIVLFITMNIFNFLNFVFHFSMARMLGPADYGVLAVLMSLIYIYAAPTEAIQNIVSRYTSKFNIEKKYGKMKFLINKSLKKGFKIGIGLFLFSIILSYFLAGFFRISFWLILLTNVFVFSVLSVPVIRGVMQGRKKFSALGWSMMLESVIKVIISISLVILGFRVFGAMIGVLMGIFSSLVFALYFNRDILKGKEEEASFERGYKKSIPYFVTLLVILFIFSLDILLAKRFFSPEVAGKYAVLSILGKMIYLATVAVSKAMFPLVSEKHDSNEDSSHLFRKSFLIVFGLCGIVVLAYWFLPGLIIGILYGKQYLDMAPYLVYAGLAFSFLSLSNIVLLYGLSTNKLKNYWGLFIFLILGIVILYLFHGSILEYILAFMVCNIIMFIGSFLFLEK